MPPAKTWCVKWHHLTASFSARLLIDKTSKMVCWLGQIGAGFESKIGSISLFRENKTRLISIWCMAHWKYGNMWRSETWSPPGEIFSLYGCVSMRDIFPSWLCVYDWHFRHGIALLCLPLSDNIVVWELRHQLIWMNRNSALQPSNHSHLRRRTSVVKVVLYTRTEKYISSHLLTKLFSIWLVRSVLPFDCGYRWYDVTSQTPQNATQSLNSCESDWGTLSGKIRSYIRWRQDTVLSITVVSRVSTFW